MLGPLKCLFAGARFSMNCMRPVFCGGAGGHAGSGDGTWTVSHMRCMQPLHSCRTISRRDASAGVTCVLRKYTNVGGWWIMS